MKRLLTGLLAPALLSVAAASQTIVVARPLPGYGVPRIFPHPVTSFPLMPARLPAPMALPLARLEAPMPVALPALVPTRLPAARFALPAVRMDAGTEIAPALRELTRLTRRLEEKPAPAPSSAPVKPSREGARLFDGEALTLPEDDLERELGLR